MNLAPGTYIHICKEAPGKQTELLPGRVLWSRDSFVAAEMDVAALKSEHEYHWILFYENDERRFIRQQTQVEGILDREAADSPTEFDKLHLNLDEAENRVVVVFQLSGEIAAAERRECYRVRVASFGVDVECEGGVCQLVDISHTGFGLLCDHKVDTGSVINVRVKTDGAVLDGPVRVQCVRQQRNGKYRYGLACLSRETQQACSEMAENFNAINYVHE